MNPFERQQKRGEREDAKESESSAEQKEIAPGALVDWIGQQASQFMEETTAQLEGAVASIGLDPVEAQRVREGANIDAQLDAVNREAVDVLRDALQDVAALESPGASECLVKRKKWDKADFLRNEASHEQDASRGSKNLGTYRFDDAFLKVVKEKRGFTADELSKLRERVHDLPNVYAPTEVFDLPQQGKDRRQGILMDIAEGMNGDDLTDDNIENIPEAHWASFEHTIRTLSERGIQVDLTKRSNFVYDGERGFLFIDIEKVAANGEPTEKFIERDGKELYYPYERFRILPVEFVSAKALFQKIPRAERPAS